MGVVKTIVTKQSAMRVSDSSGCQRKHRILSNAKAALPLSQDSI